MILPRRALQKFLSNHTPLGGSSIGNVFKSQQPSRHGLATASTSAASKAVERKRTIFERSLKEHYLANKVAVDRIGLSFLFFYVAGQVMMQKTRADELEEEVISAKLDKKELENSLKDETWTKGAARRLGLKNDIAFRNEITSRVENPKGHLTTADLSAPTI